MRERQQSGSHGPSEISNTYDLDQPVTSRSSNPGRLSFFPLRWQSRLAPSETETETERERRDLEVPELSHNVHPPKSLHRYHPGCSGNTQQRVRQHERCQQLASPTLRFTRTKDSEPLAERRMGFHCKTSVATHCYIDQ